MKKVLLLCLCALSLLSLAGCGGRPSDARIKAALDDGTITMEDAMAKGWIDQAWIEANFEVIEGASKIYLFDAFETTYLDGTPASSKLISGRMCLVFFDSTRDTTQEKLQVFRDNAAEMEKIGVPILGILTDEAPEAAREALADCPFPILVYNGEMQTSLARYKELLDTDVVSVFTRDGGFYSAWIGKTDAADMLHFAQLLADEA
ncbi:MAG: hypothetical protein RR288_02115 [Oscillibacter sp.]